MIYNSRDSFYKSPFGAVPTGTPVTFRLRLDQEEAVEPPLLEIFRWGQEESQPVATLSMVEEEISGQEQVFSCIFTPEEAGVLFYCFRVFGQEESVFFRGEDASAQRHGWMWQLTVYRSDFTTPTPFAGQIFYQIFPDRFCNSGSLKVDVPNDRRLHTSWEEEPDSYPNADGKFLCDDYFGGDLAGICQKLPYLASLGVGVIYLNPIFESHGNHRYNTADYQRIDPLLGSKEDFEELCRRAQTFGIQIVLDGVFNHTGSDSIYFNKEKRYGSGGAYNDPKSPYRDWYLWEEWPLRYQSWWGFETLPAVNENCLDYQEFICGQQGVVHSWLQAGAAGFRLDVADELPDWFIRKLRQAIKAEGKDNLILGEVWEDASIKISGGERRQYLLGEELDSVMNYPWRTAILNFIRYGGGQELENAIMNLLESYPRQVVAVLMNCLSTHDVPRAITALAAPEMSGKDRDWQREHNTLDKDTYYAGRQLFLLATVLQYTLPGCPSLYYGDEAGLVGYADPFNRGTYPWGREDQGLVDFFRVLGTLRQKYTALRQGDFLSVAFDQNSCTYLRKNESETILVCINRGDEKMILPWGETELGEATVLASVGFFQRCADLYPRSAVILLLPTSSPEIAACKKVEVP